jgi:threonine synthase
VPNVQFVVPTGNFGDILAGFYAKRLGLPMKELVVATNENDILQRFWKTGRYEKKDSSKTTEGSAETEVVQGSSDGSQAQTTGGVKETMSPAMDILVSSNFERLLFYLAYDTQAIPRSDVADSASVEQPKAKVAGAGNAASQEDRVRRAQAAVKGWMDELKREGSVDLGSVLQRAKEDFKAERVSDRETAEQIKRYYSRESRFGPYVVDPHTAVGLEATQRVAKTA